MELSKQLYREIEELQVKELFRAYNPDHMERKHILVTDGDLLQRLCRIKIEKDEIILCNTTRPFKMSAIRIILSASPVKGRLLAVRTAYPVPDSDEIDEVWEAKDEYEDKLQKNRQKKESF